jgi:hypothetical protein
MILAKSLSHTKPFTFSADPRPGHFFDSHPRAFHHSSTVLFHNILVCGRDNSLGIWTSQWSVYQYDKQKGAQRNIRDDHAGVPLTDVKLPHQTELHQSLS